MGYAIKFNAKDNTAAKKAMDATIVSGADWFSGMAAQGVPAQDLAAMHVAGMLDISSMAVDNVYAAILYTETVLLAKGYK